MANPAAGHHVARAGSAVPMWMRLNKDLSGISIDGIVFRFAACQFGQRTAGARLAALFAPWLASSLGSRTRCTSG
jgi:hypothetical protein